MTRTAPALLVTMGFAAALAIAPLTTSAAQQPAPLRQPDSIPFELAAALVSSGGLPGEPQILVGSMPEWLSNRIAIPTGARVLGSAFIGTTVVGVLSLPTTSDSVIPDLRRELMQRGWTAAPAAPRFSVGGFNAAPPMSPEGPATRITLCSDQQILTAAATRRRGIATDIVLRMSVGGTSSACHPMQMSMPMIVRSPFPTLFNPQGATDGRMTGDCSATMMGSMGTGTTLRSSMPADALLDHYARQLQDSGWKSFGEKGAILGRSWTRVDSAGAPVEVSITVTASPRDAACRDLNLQVRTLRKP